MRRNTISEFTQANRRPLAFLGLIVSLLPLMYLLVLLRLYHVDVPFLDEWEYMLILPKSYEGTLSLADLFALHNEHRLLFPRLIMLGLARLTHWNMVYETAAAVVFAIAAFCVLLFMLRDTAKKAAASGLAMLVPALSLMYFSLSQWQNWFMPCQFLMFFNLLTVMGAILLLARPETEWGSYIAALVLAVMASYSFANGLSIWPIGLLCILVIAPPRKGVFALVWCLTGAVVVALYFHGYHSPQYHPSPWNTLRQPGAFVLYVLRYLGAPVIDYSGTGAAVAGAVGLAVLALTSVFLMSRRKIAMPYWGLALYAISGAVTTGIGRLGFGIDQATSSRYITVGNLLWVADLVLLMLVWSALGRPRKSGYLLACAAAVFVLLSSVNSVYGTLKWTERYTFRLPARAELISGGTNEDLLQRLHPSPKLVIERREILKKYRLGVFR